MFRLNQVEVKGILRVETLNIPEKSITCIAGESGSGKSTLLRLLNHMDSPDQGQIFFHDMEISKMDPIQLRRHVIMVPQSPIIFEGTVNDNLKIGLSFAERFSSGQESLETALYISCFNNDLQQDAQHLSGGEKQRLALARAIIMDPEVLLLDEPTAALDEHTAIEVMNRLSKYIYSNEKTLIMITHSRSIVETYADRIVELHRGKLFQEGKINDGSSF